MNKIFPYSYIFVLLIVIVFSVFSVNGIIPNIMKSPVPQEDSIAVPETPEGGNNSLQLRTLKFKTLPPAQKSCMQSTAIDMVLDRSGSMGNGTSLKDKMSELKLGVINFINLMADESLLGIQSFGGSNAKNDFPMDKLGSRRDSVIAKIKRLTGDGNTPMIFGLEMAKKELESAKAKFPNYDFNMILLSDGQPNHPDSSIKERKKVVEFIPQIKNLNVRVFTIAYGDKDVKQLMIDMASSPGDSYYTPDSDQIQKILEQISKKICE